ncbi:Uma2 family endonuclease [Streptomyces sp. NPDC058807]|uniref:Uma2 family endonuclease n=1 Tax=unclassified Streptomyces TaxID=2593676 RepID=UPI0036C3C1F2
MREFEGDCILADNAWDEIVWVRRQTEAPKGCKAEIVEGLITVTPLSSVAHNGVAERVQRRLYDVIPEDGGIYQRLPLAAPGRLGLFEPDLAVVPEALLREGDEHLIPASEAELVVEIVSYRVLYAGKVGDPVVLPAPFQSALATSEFPGR